MLVEYATFFTIIKNAVFVDMLDVKFKLLKEYEKKHLHETTEGAFGLRHDGKKSKIDEEAHSNNKWSKKSIALQG